MLYSAGSLFGLLFFLLEYFIAFRLVPYVCSVRGLSSKINVHPTLYLQFLLDFNMVKFQNCVALP